MISRKKIISRSQTELNLTYDSEDVWFSPDVLFQDHITEILQKWDKIDDEIWCKVICMERNRRTAKAYARSTFLTISGSEDGFDGYKIGLNGFENPYRDRWTNQVKSRIGKGARLKIDDMGNIVIKRMSESGVFIKTWDSENNSLSKDIIDLGGELEMEKTVRLFDMKKFQAGIARELRSAYPDRRKLESHCICAIAFVKDSSDILDLCSWVILINIVAIDLLKSQFPAIQERDINKNLPKFVSIYDDTPEAISRQKLIAEEDPYSLPYPVTFGKLQDKSYDRKRESSLRSKTYKSSDPPPELPPRDFVKAKKGKTSRNIPRAIKALVKSSEKSCKIPSKTSDLMKSDREYEDPYFCGLQARVPNWPSRPANLMTPKIMEQEVMTSSEIRKSHSSGYLNSLFRQSNFFPHKDKQKCNSNPYYDSSLDSDIQGQSSGSGYEVYTPYGYGIRPLSVLTVKNGIVRPVNKQHFESRPNYQHQKYASEWE